MNITSETLARIIKEELELVRINPNYHDIMSHKLHLDQVDTITDRDTPHIDSYLKVREFLISNPDIEDLALNMLMDLAGSSCKKSTKVAIIDHLQMSLS